jgi:hypothetical protein
MIRLIVPKEILRPVRFSMHFPRKSKEDIRAIDDPDIRTRLFERWPLRPYGHDILELKCGHTVVRVRTHPGPILWRPQPCRMCSQRDREMNVRYIRSDLKKRRRARKAVKVRRQVVLHLKRRRQE